MFSWPPQGHWKENEKKKKRKIKSPAVFRSSILFVVLHICRHAITGRATCRNRCCAEWHQWCVFAHLREYLSQMLYYILWMLIPVHLSTRAQGGEVILETVAKLLLSQCFCLVFQFLHQLFWHIKQPPDNKLYSPWQIVCWFKMIKFTIPVKASDFFLVSIL